MSKPKALIKISLLLYLLVSLVILVCLFKVRYHTVTIYRVQIEKIETCGAYGVLAIARYYENGDSRIPFGNPVTHVEGVESGVSCSCTGKIIAVGNMTTDASKYFGIYIEGAQHADILRHLVEMSKSQAVEIDGGREPLFKKVIQQLLWKRKSL